MVALFAGRHCIVVLIAAQEFKVMLRRFRLRLHWIGHVQIRLGSDPLWSGFTLFTQDQFKIGTVRFHMGSPSKPDSRSDRYRIHQVLCKHKAYEYQFRASSKRIRSRVNAALDPVYTNTFSSKPPGNRKLFFAFSLCIYTKRLKTVTFENGLKENNAKRYKNCGCNTTGFSLTKTYSCRRGLNFIICHRF